MTREELIEFAKYLDEGCDLLGEGYIESRTDEYLRNVANKNFVLADVSSSCQHEFVWLKPDEDDSLDRKCEKCGFVEWHDR